MMIVPRTGTIDGASLKTEEIDRGMELTKERNIE